MDAGPHPPGEDAARPPASREAACRLALNAALVGSRQRWQDFAALAADLAFETDAQGRFTFVAPDPALGYAAGALIGRRAASLLLGLGDGPFGPGSGGARDLRCWVRPAAGEPVCLAFTVAALHDEAGRAIGLRGVARDVTAEEREADATAASLRHFVVLDTLTRQVRREMRLHRVVPAALECLAGALGCRGAAIVDWGGRGPPWVMHGVGEDGAPVLAALAAEGLPPVAGADEDRFLLLPDLGPVAALPYRHRPGTELLLLAWRGAAARDWDADDRRLLRSLGDLLRVLIGRDLLQRELEQQARTDPLTGLLNRRAFLEDLERRLERADHGGTGGALLFGDLDHFKVLNDSLGHEAGDVALRIVAALLREGVRPTDLVARFGGDEFAVWLEDADAQDAAARVAALREAVTARFRPTTPTGRPALSLTFGIAMRAPYQTEAVDALLARADAAMYATKRQGRAARAPRPRRPAPPLPPSAALLS